MAKRTELDGYRQAVEMLVDVYGAELYDYVCSRMPDDESASRVFVQIWVSVFRGVQRRGARRDDRKRVLATADQVISTSTDSVDASTTEPTVSGSDNVNAEDVTVPVITAELRHRVSRVLVATQAQMAAERVYRGPVWVWFAVSSTVVAAVALIAYGVYRSSRFANLLPGHAWVVSQVSNLPPPLQGLPTTPIAQFGLTPTEDKLDISHVGVTKDALYLPQLFRPGGSRSTWQLDVHACALPRSGEPLDAVLTHVASVALVEPRVSPKQRASHGRWTVNDWKFEVSGPWAITIMNWANASIPNAGIDQVYAMYIPTRKSALVSSFQPQTGLADIHVVAAGDGRVVEQSGFTNPSPRGQFTIVGLPIRVYRLQGTNPTAAWSAPTQLTTPFGMISAPTVTPTGIVFQGLAGQFQAPNAQNATWFALSWNGQLTKWIGPPLDGQPHFAVEGGSGTRYWVETTPDRLSRGDVQVLMSPLIPIAQSSAAASTLSGAVQSLAVSGGYVVWIQTENAKPQLVVSAAN